MHLHIFLHAFLRTQSWNFEEKLKGREGGIYRGHLWLEASKCIINVLKTRSKFKGDNFDRVIKKNYAYFFNSWNSWEHVPFFWFLVTYRDV